MVGGDIKIKFKISMLNEDKYWWCSESENKKSKLWKPYELREQPFNLKEGGLRFFSKKNILIPNVAEKNILILVEEKKIIWFRVFVI